MTDLEHIQPNSNLQVSSPYYKWDYALNINCLFCRRPQFWRFEILSLELPLRILTIIFYSTLPWPGLYQTRRMQCRPRKDESDSQQIFWL